MSLRPSNIPFCPSHLPQKGQGHLARSSPPSTSNHGPTAHESRRGGVAWLGQAVRWSGSGAGPTGCHQASGGGCSGLPQPIMNSGCGAAWLAGRRGQDNRTFLFRCLPLLLVAGGCAVARSEGLSRQSRHHLPAFAGRYGQDERDTGSQGREIDYSPIGGTNEEGDL